MKRPLLAALVGLLAGSALGGLLALALYPRVPSDDGWTSYPTLASPVPGDGRPVLWQDVRNEMTLSYFLFFGLLLGGGFGAVTGALTGATAALLHPAAGRSADAGPAPPPEAGPPS